MKTLYVLGNEHNANFLSHKFKDIVELSAIHFPSEDTVPPHLLLFAGGQDLCPSLYGKHYPQVYGSKQRDEWEVAWFNFAVKHKVPMFGICRGMQLFTAMTGGELIPHVNNHVSGHFVHTGKEFFRVNSIHHQMCVPSENARVLAWAEGVAFKHPKREPEAIWFPSVNALGVQWHPEMLSYSPAHKPARDYVLSIVEEYLNV